MTKTEKTLQWSFDFWDDEQCLTTLAHDLENLPNKTVRKTVEKKLQNKTSLYDLERWACDQLQSSYEDESASETASQCARVVTQQEEWEEVTSLIRAHQECDCQSFLWEAYAQTDWQEWLTSLLPEGPTLWALIDNRAGTDVALGETFTLKELTEALGNHSGWVQFEATYLPDTRTLKFQMGCDPGVLTGTIYATTSDELQLVKELDFYDEQGIYWYFANNHNHQLLHLIDHLYPMPIVPTSETTWWDWCGADYFSDAYHEAHALLTGIPEEARSVLYRLAPDWGKSVTELRVAAVASTLPAPAREVFMALAGDAELDTDLLPSADIALATVLVPAV